jgi:hypothetical protein
MFSVVFVQRSCLKNKRRYGSARIVHQFSERLQVVEVVNPAYSLGPAWELLDSVQSTVLNNQPRAVKTEKKRRGFQLTLCVPGGTASV